MFAVPLPATATAYYTGVATGAGATVESVRGDTGLGDQVQGLRKLLGELVRLNGQLAQVICKYRESGL